MATQTQASDPAPLERSREGLAVMALAMSAFVLNLNSNVMGALLPFLRDEFGFEDEGRSMLLAAAGLGSAIGAFVVAQAMARFGRRTVLVQSLALFVVASLLHVVTTSFAPLLALRAIAGFATGLAYATASAIVADLVPYERRGQVMGRFNAGLFLAIPIGLPLTVWLASLGQWRVTFVLQAGVGVLALLLSLRLLPPLGATPPVRRWPVLRHRGVVPVLLSTMLHVGSFFTVVQLATSWLDETGVVTKEQQIWIWVGLGALSVLGSAVLGRVADRVGKRTFVLLCSAVLVVCFIVLAKEPSPPILLAVGCVLAVVAAARTGPLQALASGLVPSAELGALMGLRGVCMQLGVGGFALGSAALGDRFGFQGVLVLAIGCQLLSYAAIRVGVHEPNAQQSGTATG